MEIGVDPDPNPTAAAAAPSVYVYDMPPIYNVHFLPGSPLHRKQDSRVEMELIHERLLSSSLRVVSGPADLYFIPVSLSFVRPPPPSGTAIIVVV
jgi:hypothetical protein